MYSAYMNWAYGEAICTPYQPLKEQVHEEEETERLQSRVCDYTESGAFAVQAEDVDVKQPG